MKNLKKMNKFNSFYYIGLSVILTFLLIVFLSLSAISGLIIGHFSNNSYNDEEIKKIENAEILKEKKIVYDTVKVEIYDTVKVTPKKIKHIIKKEQAIDSIN